MTDTSDDPTGARPRHEMPEASTANGLQLLGDPDAAVCVDGICAVPADREQAHTNG